MCIVTALQPINSCCGMGGLYPGNCTHQLGFSMPQAMAKKSRKSGVVDLHIT